MRIHTKKRPENLPQTAPPPAPKKAEKTKRPTIKDLKEEVEFYKKMSEYYKKRFTESVEIRKNIVSENIGLIASFETLDKKCAEYEHELKRLRRKWYNIFKF